MADQYKMKVTKIEACKEQLEAAIVMFFDNTNPISVHTLASASLALVRDLLNKNEGSSYLKDIEDRIKPEHLNSFRVLLSSSANFFKHADRDHDTVHEFNIETNDIKLFEACILFKEYSGFRTDVMQGYMVWMLCMRTELFQVYSEIKSHPEFNEKAIKDASRETKLGIGKQMIQRKYTAFEKGECTK